MNHVVSLVCWGLLLSMASAVTVTDTRPQQSRCQLPQAPGMCRAYIPSFYYNSDRNECQIFVYGGCGGNANRFSSLQACNEACLPPPVNACQQSKVVGMCRAAHRRWYYNGSQCLQFIYGGCGGNANRFSSLQACNEACLSPPVNACQQSKVVGMCRAAHRRWYYNGSQCLQFIYGGCGGNANRFSSLQACNEACLPPPVNACQQTKEVGPCRAAHRRWYYNGSQCLRFIYGGCRGNDNNFISQDLCNQRCLQQ